jgi:hypothetical protein
MKKNRKKVNQENRKFYIFFYLDYLKMSNLFILGLLEFLAIKLPYIVSI